MKNRDDFGSGPARDDAGYAECPPEVRWPGDAGVAVQIVVNYRGQQTPPLQSRHGV